MTFLTATGGAGFIGRERGRRRVIVKLGVSPSAGLWKSLAVLLHEEKVCQRVRYVNGERTPFLGAIPRVGNGPPSRNLLPILLPVMWAQEVSNLRPLPSERSALPLSYAPAAPVGAGRSAKPTPPCQSRFGAACSRSSSSRARRFKVESAFPNALKSLLEAS